MNDRQEVFENIYLQRKWKSQESVSGLGSDLDQTEGVRAGLLFLTETLKIRTLLDAACGDFNWMKSLSLPLEKYVGVDIVPPLIASNIQFYGSPEREFLVGDIVQDALQQVDLILCRDCLNHLTLEDGLKALQNFRNSGSRYLAATTFPELSENTDIGVWSFNKSSDGVHFETGDWRRLNLALPPFNLGEPRQTILESGEGRYHGKALGLWVLQDEQG